MAAVGQALSRAGTGSEVVRASAPAYEDYTLTATPRGTKVTVNITQDFESMPAACSKALAKLKALRD